MAAGRLLLLLLRCSFLRTLSRGRHNRILPRSANLPRLLQAFPASALQFIVLGRPPTLILLRGPSLLFRRNDRASPAPLYFLAAFSIASAPLAWLLRGLLFLLPFESLLPQYFLLFPSLLLQLHLFLKQLGISFTHLSFLLQQALVLIFLGFLLEHGFNHLHLLQFSVFGFLDRELLRAFDLLIKNLLALDDRFELAGSFLLASGVRRH